MCRVAPARPSVLVLRVQVAGLFLAWVAARLAARYWFPVLVGLGGWAAWSVASSFQLIA